jgi:hypothetical protein
VTVTTTNSAQEYVGDGATLAFQGTFPALRASYIFVSVDGFQVSRTLVGDFTQPFVWDAVLASPPAVGAKVIVFRTTTQTQGTAYTPYGRYQANQVETDFDRAMMIAQEIEGGTSGGSGGVAAVNVSFNPTATVLADDVQAAIEEVDFDWRDTLSNAADTLQLQLDAKADKTTAITTFDIDTILLNGNVFADLSADVQVRAVTNQPWGLVQLDGSSKIPIGSVNVDILNFVGFWSPPAEGPNPPAVANSGDLYIFEAAGNMNLLIVQTGGGEVPQVVAVDIQDYMIFVNTNPAHANGWYYVARTLPPVSAINVIINPPIVGLPANNVYAGLEAITLYALQANKDATITANWSFTQPLTVNERINVKDVDSNFDYSYRLTSGLSALTGVIGFEGDTNIRIRNYIFGGGVSVYANTTGGITHPQAIFSPDAGATFFGPDGNPTLEVDNGGIIVASDFSQSVFAQLRDANGLRATWQSFGPAGDMFLDMVSSTARYTLRSNNRNLHITDYDNGHSVYAAGNLGFALTNADARFYARAPATFPYVALYAYDQFTQYGYVWSNALNIFLTSTVSGGSSGLQYLDAVGTVRAGVITQVAGGNLRAGPGVVVMSWTETSATFNVPITAPNLATVVGRAKFAGDGTPLSVSGNIQVGNSRSGVGQYYITLLASYTLNTLCILVTPDVDVTALGTFAICGHGNQNQTNQINVSMKRTGANPVYDDVGFFVEISQIV